MTFNTWNNIRKKSKRHSIVGSTLNAENLINILLKDIQNCLKKDRGMALYLVAWTVMWDLKRYVTVSMGFMEPMDSRERQLCNCQY